MHTARTVVLAAVAALILMGRPLAVAAPAFPGAEGAGMWTRGGRGGTVYAVTNLNDGGPGSLREAVDGNGARTVVFVVSGTIALTNNLDITNSHITIAGQTAPGDGICLKDYQLRVDTDEVVLRYLRCRPADNNATTQAVDGISVGIGSEHSVTNVIIDHCSVSWSVDEALSVVGAKIDRVTVQWCLITEALHDAVHWKGPHSCGGIIRGTPGHSCTYHHNLFAHNVSRNALIGSVGAAEPGFLVDFRNNVIYDWLTGATYTSGDDVAVAMNMVANVYKPGPCTPMGEHATFMRIGDSNHVVDLYAEGNHMTTYPGGDSDNFKMIDDRGADLEALSDPVSMATVATVCAEVAYEQVIAAAGAVLPERDAADTRVIAELIEGTGRIIHDEEEVGGWPTLYSETAPTDSDGDGMPDEWENDRGYLDRDDGTDGAEDHDSDGYTNLEDYLNALCVRRLPGGLWRLDEASGTNILDGFGHGNDGTLIDLPAGCRVDGIAGGAIAFDGNGYARIDSKPTLDFGSNDFSVAYWMKTAYTGATDMVLIDKRYPFCSRWSASGQRLYFSVNPYADGEYQGWKETWSDSALNDGKWHYIVGTVGNGVTNGVKLYVDGVAQAKHDTATGTFDGYPILLGRDWADTEHYDGLLDEARVVPRALTAEEIGQAYRDTITLAEWRFEESVESTNVLDHWDGHDGTLVNLAPTNCRLGGCVGYGIEFDGSGYAQIDNDPALDFGSNDFSVAYWMKTAYTGATDMVLIDKSYPFRSTWRASAQRLYFSVNPYADGEYQGWKETWSDSALNDGKWRYIVGTVGNGVTNGVKLYVDGVAQAKHDTATGTFDGYPITLGRDSTNTEYYVGRLDQVAVYAKALTSNEVYDTYQSARLLGSWSFGEGGGVTVKDSSVHFNHGTLMDMPGNCRVADVGGDALEFDGSGYVKILNDLAFQFVDSDYSVSLWMKTSGTNEMVLVNRRYALWVTWSAGSERLSFAVNPYLEGEYQGWQHARSDSALNNGKWHHVVGTLENGVPDGVKMYVDGVLQATPASATGTLDTADILIGRHWIDTADEDYEGLLDEVRIFSGALSSNEVADLYAEGEARVGPGPSGTLFKLW